MSFWRSGRRFWSLDNSSERSAVDSGRSTTVLSSQLDHFGRSTSLLARPRAPSGAAPALRTLTRWPAASTPGRRSSPPGRGISSMPDDADALSPLAPMGERKNGDPRSHGRVGVFRVSSIRVQAGARISRILPQPDGKSLPVVDLISMDCGSSLVEAATGRVDTSTGLR